MKLRIPFLALWAFLLVGSCDKCKEVECDNGGECVDGACVCPDAFTGDHCSLQKEPRSIAIKSVEFIGMSEWLNWEWDEGDFPQALPDVVLGAQKGISSSTWFLSNEVFENSKADRLKFTQDFPLVLDDIHTDVRFSLHDLDEEDNLIYEIYWWTVRLYSSQNNFPSTIELHSEWGQSLIIEVDYLY